MRSQANRWSLVLAAGSGTRLESLTKVGGTMPIPKQYWSLNGGPSLLEETLKRAHSVTSPERTAVVVAAEHRGFWQRPLRHLADANIVVQPRNRGTAIGILLGLAAIVYGDPDAIVVVLPSDHFVAGERILRRAILQATVLADTESGALTFLGVEPESADSELGYIVRGEPSPSGGFHIAEFVEKPISDDARRLVARGALWNSFIVVGRAADFIDLIRRRFPAEVAALLAAATIDDTARRSIALERLYAEMRCIDFSHDVVRHADAGLRVMPVACGWSDLGTPQRVAECLGRLSPSQTIHDASRLSLAAAHARLAESLAAGIGQWA